MTNLRLVAARKTMLVAICSALAGCTSSETTLASSAPTTVGSVTATSGQAAALPELTETYVSPWYGYAVGYPSGWETTDGKGPWPSGKVLLHGDPRLDVIEGSAPGGQARFVAVSRPVAAGTTLRELGGQENPFSCGPGDQLPKGLTIDGAAAFVTLDGCPSEAELGGLIWDIVVIRGGRGYDFTIDGAISASDAAAWLARIRLDPASARTK